MRHDLPHLFSREVCSWNLNDQWGARYGGIEMAPSARIGMISLALWYRVERYWILVMVC